MTEKPEVIEVESESTAVAPVDYEDPVEQDKRSIELVTRRRRMAVKMTVSTDWLGQRDPKGNVIMYLEGTGAERIAQCLGVVKRITAGPITEWHEDDLGKYYTVRYDMEIHNRDGDLLAQEQGFCSSRDKFFGTKGGVLKRLEEIDITMIQRKALNNAFVRAVSRAYGLRGLTEQQLREFSGGDVDFKTVDYGSGKKGGGASKPKQQTKAPEIPADLPAVPDSAAGMKDWSDAVLVGVWLREIERAKAEYGVTLDELYLGGLKKDPGYWVMKPHSANKMTDKRREWFKEKLLQAVKENPPADAEQSSDDVQTSEDPGEVTEDDIPWSGKA